MLCPTSGKIRHTTAQAARSHMAALIAHDGSIRMNVYPCGDCQGWHVGHARGLARDIKRAVAQGTAKTRANRRRKRRR